MRYTEIRFPKVLGLNQQINGVEEPNFLKRISFKYEGKSSCIYKKHDDVKSALFFVEEIRRKKMLSCCIG